jgi:uncharacterized membrane protein YcaP (DUF421 family)
VEIPDFGSSLVDVAIRTAIVYFFLIGGLRLAGKREVGQLSIFDLIVLLVIADAVQNSMVGENMTLAGGIVAASTLILLDKFLAIASNRNPRLRKFLEGEPQVVVRDGVVLEEALQKEGIDREELDAALRAHGVLDPTEVELAVLETSGSISVIPRHRGGSAQIGREPPSRPTI